MKPEAWYLILGGLLVVVTLIGTSLQRLPLTTTIFYLVAGITLGPLGFGIGRIDAFQQAAIIERIAEVGVIVSLFTAGLKLRARFEEQRWRIAIRLAFLSMALTVGLISLVGYYLLALPLGAAVLLGAVLAPTDPVLASDVQLENASDKDKVRFSLTGEAGLNDGTAFPFVMLGLGLLGLHELGAGWWRWLAVDVLWAIAGGVGIGAVAGTLIGRLVVYLRRVHQEGIGRDELLALGLIAFSYGAALLAHTYGFLAVFAAGLALRRIEHTHTRAGHSSKVQELGCKAHNPELATDHEHAPLHMAETVLASNERAERVLEVGLVLLLGLMLSREHFRLDYLWFVPVLFFMIRPAAVLAGLVFIRATHQEKFLLSWFGIRGIGSIYYLMYAIARGVPEETGRTLIAIVFSVIAISIVAHGISVTPLMNWHRGHPG